MGVVLNLVANKRSKSGSGKGRFLIVDDETSASLILKSILEGEGLRVEAVRNEQEMFDLLDRYSFDAVFLDYKLGNANGLKLLPRILREHPYCRIIMITAHGSIDLAVDAVKKGVSGFITKPFDEEKVLGEIKKALREKKEAKTELVKYDESGIVGKSPRYSGYMSRSIR